MNIIKSLCGTLTIEIVSADPVTTLKQIMVSGISVSQITKKSELVYAFSILQKDFQTVTHILQKRGDTLNVIFKKGIYWKFKSLLCRPVLISTFLILVTLTIYLPTRVLFIEAEGYQTRSSSEILSAAENTSTSLKCW